MLRSLFVILFVGLVGVGVYLYADQELRCPIPIEYSFGTIDERFGVSTAEVKAAMARAEAVWEVGTGRELFAHVEGADDLVVNFIYDERQARALAEETLREDLDEQQQESQSINETYAELTARYKKANTEYQADLRAYEERLADYNERVEQYNAQGGAPPGVYDELQQEAEALDRESDALNRAARRLNSLAADINALSDEGNQFIEDYNENVERYNRSFGESVEFTQGDYSRDSINIYKFVNTAELDLVLVHELGHALGIDHVEGPESVMYYLMGQQPAEIALSTHDKAAFTAVCGDGNDLFGFLPINL